MFDIKGIRHNYAYFPIFIDENKYGLTRDELYYKLRKKSIYGRRYFFPLISEFPTYSGLPSSNPNNLVVAEKIAKQVICLPIYPDIDQHSLNRIISVI